MLVNSLNVLVVDDVTLMCDFLYSVANTVAGCKAYKALDFKTANEILDREVIDLLITDIELKEASGIDLLRKLREGGFSNTAYDIPIIVFSGNTYRKLIQQCISYDVNDFLAKPISADVLTRKILQHLQSDKIIQPIRHYQDITTQAENALISSDDELVSPLRVAIVRELPQVTDPDETALKKADETSSKHDFLTWPADVTTGFYQLDRRFKRFAYSMSCFHNVFINNCKMIAVETERNKACASADYLIQIAKTMQKREARPDFWRLLQLRLDKLKTLINEFAEVNVKHHKQVQSLLKKLAYWWLHTCNKPLVQRIEVANDIVSP